MKTIPLTQGKEALVSDCDYGHLMQWKWYYTKHINGHSGYAVRHDNSKTGAPLCYMHKVVAARKGLLGQVDHRDQNKLNNCRRNLRKATCSQNGANRGPQTNNNSGFKGVRKHAQVSRWEAEIGIKGETRYLGIFPLTERGKKAAARAYNQAARKHFGKFAVLNRV